MKYLLFKIAIVTHLRDLSSSVVTGLFLLLLSLIWCVLSVASLALADLVTCWRRVLSDHCSPARLVRLALWLGPGPGQVSLLWYCFCLSDSSNFSDFSWRTQTQQPQRFLLKLLSWLCLGQSLPERQSSTHPCESSSPLRGKHRPIWVNISRS